MCRRTLAKTAEGMKHKYTSTRGICDPRLERRRRRWSMMVMLRMR